MIGCLQSTLNIVNIIEMKTQEIHYFRYLFILATVVATAEYLVMILFDITGLASSLPREAEAITDSLLLLLLSASPVYFWIIKPVLTATQEYQSKLENLVEALDGSGDAAMITDTAGSIQYVNKAVTIQHPS